MEKAQIKTEQKASLCNDVKFRWMVFSVAVVAVFEFLSLTGFNVFKYAVVAVLFTFGETLEKFGIATSKSAFQAFFDPDPNTAAIKRVDDALAEVPLVEVRIGDVLVSKPLDMIAMEAEVVPGASFVDEWSLTGGPLPNDKHDIVFAGTLNMRARVRRTGHSGVISLAPAIFADVGVTDVVIINSLRLLNHK